jgi:GNAT superfamily N-acetyltransferase
MIPDGDNSMNVQSFEQKDIPDLVELQPAGWSDIRLAFDFYWRTDFCFPIKVTVDHKLVGCGAAIIHHDNAWLAQIIVHPAYRNRGIGKLITETLIDCQPVKSCETIHLIATDLGAPVYEKVGFVTDAEYLFFKDVQPHPAWTISSNIKPFIDRFVEEVAALDRQISTEDRIAHLKMHQAEGFVYLEDNRVQGFYLPTFGDGLILANTATAGIELMKMRFKSKDYACFPAGNVVARNFLDQLGQQAFRTAKRMRLGRKRDWNPTGIYNRIGGNLG